MQSIPFSFLPKADTMAAYGDHLVMYDNIGQKLEDTLSKDVFDFINQEFPIKIDFAVIILCVEGSIEIECNLRCLSAKKDGLIILPAGTIGESLKIDPDSTLVVISTPDYTIAPVSGFSNFTFAQENFLSPLCIDLDHDVVESGIETYLQLKKTILEMPDKMSDDLIKAYVMVMAGLVSVNFHNWFSKEKEEQKNSKEKILKDFLSRADMKHREHRSVTYYAEKAGLSSKYFAKVIFNASGKRPLDWIRDYVILDAKSMIKNKEYSIGEICKMLNFTNQSQFNKYFKDATGMTPLEYRRNPKI